MKKLLLTASLLFSIISSYSQTFTPPAYAEINTSYQTYINNIFGKAMVQSNLTFTQSWLFPLSGIAIG